MAHFTKPELSLLSLWLTGLWGTHFLLELCFLFLGQWPGFWGVRVFCREPEAWYNRDSPAAALFSACQMKWPSPDELFAIVLWLCHPFSPSLDWQTQIIRLHWKWCTVGFCLASAVVISCNSLDTAECTNTTGTAPNQPYMRVDYVMLRVHDDDGGVLISVDKRHLFSSNIQCYLSFLLNKVCFFFTSLDRDCLVCARMAWFILWDEMILVLSQMFCTNLLKNKSKAVKCNLQ